MAGTLTTINMQVMITGCITQTSIQMVGKQARIATTVPVGMKVPTTGNTRWASLELLTSASAVAWRGKHVLATPHVEAVSVLHHLDAAVMMPPARAHAERHGAVLSSLMNAWQAPLMQGLQRVLALPRYTAVLILAQNCCNKAWPCGCCRQCWGPICLSRASA